MDGVIFIGAVVVALVDAIKALVPSVHGAVTVVVAGLIGGILGALGSSIGLVDVSLATGVMAGFAASGAVGVAKRV